MTGLPGGSAAAAASVLPLTGGPAAKPVWPSAPGSSGAGTSASPDRPEPVVVQMPSRV